MKVYEFEDLKTKKLVREVGERMDAIALSYLDLVIDMSEQEYPDGGSDEELEEFCNRVGFAFLESLTKACETRGLY